MTAIPEPIHQDPLVYCIQVTLPRNPLKVLNSYVLVDDGQALLIDTGFNQPESRADLLGGLRALSMELEKAGGPNARALAPQNLRLFLTHGHADHVGLVCDLLPHVAEVLINPVDYQIIADTLDGTWWRQKRVLMRACGFSAQEVEAMDQAATRDLGTAAAPFAYTPVQGGDVIQVGRVSLRCLATPGHTRGHLCLYYEPSQLLFSGDHILFDISPNIITWTDAQEQDSLGLYLQSLALIRPLPVKLVLPGHRSPASQLEPRVCDLLTHHAHRLQECQDAVSTLNGERPQGATVKQVTQRVSWHIRAHGWDDWPPSQKMFAGGETQAHLEHLAVLGRLRRSLDPDGTLRFFA
jgi:glyoxylase-like metal-dependent hydrolase (beta-lactamase superfamily II)